MKPNAWIVAVLVSAGVFVPALAEEPAQEIAVTGTGGSIIDAIVNGKPVVDVRYRFEWKEQDGFSDDAFANTIRTRLGYETAEFHSFSVLVEFENVAVLGADRFNSTTNGRIAFPVIADPEATEVNRAQVTFTGIPETELTLGRQRINLANQRFIGAVDFRQNQQTFDAARVHFGPFGKVSADYIYIDRVHRIFGDDSPMGEFSSDSHALTVGADGGTIGKLTGYGLLLDLEEAPALSSATFGVRYENRFLFGKDDQFGISVAAEFASQSDYGGNPFGYRESYVLGELGENLHNFGITAGYESLGGNGAIGFSTPLATLHKFQGFADAFLITPVDGIRDLYGKVSYQISPAWLGAGIGLFAVYHDFRTERGSLDLGWEVDAGMTVRIKDHWSLELKGAVFDGGVTGPADRNLVWTSLRFQY